MTHNKEHAKQIIVEIVRQAGGDIGKTKMFKSFWLAHLFYAQKAKGYLSDWPIVRMPMGPGIHRGDRLIDELLEEGKLERTYEQKGPFREINCRLIDRSTNAELTAEAVLAIREAVEYVKGHTAESISELSHEFSRSWNMLDDGEAMNIYTDLIPDDEYQQKKEELVELKKAYEDLFE